MTKSEAVQQMRLGEKVRHCYFSDNEWVKMEGDRYVFEDNVRVKPHLFWHDRNDPAWDTDWEVVKVVQEEM